MKHNPGVSEWLDLIKSFQTTVKQVIHTSQQTHSILVLLTGGMFLLEKFSLLITLPKWQPLGGHYTPPPVPHGLLAVRAE